MHMMHSHDPRKGVAGGGRGGGRWQCCCFSLLPFFCLGGFVSGSVRVCLRVFVSVLGFVAVFWSVSLLLLAGGRNCCTTSRKHAQLSQCTQCAQMNIYIKIVKGQGCIICINTKQTITIYIYICIYVYICMYLYILYVYMYIYICLHILYIYTFVSRRQQPSSCIKFDSVATFGENNVFIGCAHVQLNLSVYMHMRTWKLGRVLQHQTTIPKCEGLALSQGTTQISSLKSRTKNNNVNGKRCGVLFGFGNLEIWFGFIGFFLNLMLWRGPIDNTKNKTTETSKMKIKKIF